MAAENHAFMDVDNVFKREMKRCSQDRNCYRALIVNVKDFISKLKGLNEKLEGIQKNLKQFLESKRSNFPRFYFLSDEDLLEIIGNSKDPEPINKHIKKIYEGINKLITDSGSGGRGASKVHTIVELEAPDGERIALHESFKVVVESKIEQWLAKVT